MLAVDRNDFASAALARGGDDVTRHYQRLFIRERHPFAALECRQRCLEAGRSHDGVEHDVDVIARRGFDQARRPTAPFLCTVVAISDHTHEPWAKSIGLFTKEICVAERRQRGNAKPRRLSFQHTQRGRSDRTR